MEQKDEILRPLSYQDLLNLIEVYNTDKSSSTRGFNYLLTQKKMLDLKEANGPEIFRSDRERIKFYTHKHGNLKNGTFIAICGPLDYWIFISSLEESGEEIRECIFNTELIEWNLGPFFASNDEREAFMLLDFLKQKNYEVEIENWNVVAHQKKKEASMIEYNVPEDVYIAALKMEDCRIIDDLWPHRYVGSLKFVQDLVINNGGIGLYSKDSDKLLCWVIKNEIGSPGYVTIKYVCICKKPLNINKFIRMLQTIDEAKRKGYAAIVMKAIATKLASEDDLDIVAFIRSNNEGSKKLFERLGYNFIGNTCYIKANSF